MVKGSILIVLRRMVTIVMSCKCFVGYGFFILNVSFAIVNFRHSNCYCCFPIELVAGAKIGVSCFDVFVVLSELLL